MGGPVVTDGETYLLHRRKRQGVGATLHQRGGKGGEHTYPPPPHTHSMLPTSTACGTCGVAGGRLVGAEGAVDAAAC